MKKKLTLYFLQEFFGSLFFTRGIFVLFLLSRKISMTEVGILQTMLFLSNMFCEVPTGLLADKFKRKYSVSIGLLLLAFGAFIMPFANSFGVFALAFLLQGIGFAFRSGANEALLYDELKAAGDSWSSRYVNLSARCRSLINLGMIVAMGTGGFIQEQWGWFVVYSLVGISMTIAAICSLIIDETSYRIYDKLKKETPSYGIIKNIHNFFSTREGRLLVYFVLGMGFIEATQTPIFIYIQNYLKDSGMSESHTSLMIALSLVLTSFSYLWAHFLNSFSLDHLIYFTTLILVVLTSTFLFHPPIAIGIFFFALIDMIPSLLFVYTDNYINKQIPSHVRASLLSFHSLVNSIFVSLVFLWGGYLLDILPAFQVLGSLAIFPLLGFFSLFMYFQSVKKQKVIEEAK